MKTVTLDILDDKAINLLKDLEVMKVIKLHEPEDRNSEKPINSFTKYKGMMTKQPIKEIDKQLKELRDEWGD
jgi:hypothetical protein